jgi:hypothetical protein
MNPFNFIHCVGCRELHPRCNRCGAVLAWAADTMRPRERVRACPKCGPEAQLYCPDCNAPMKFSKGFAWYCDMGVGTK